MSDNKNREFVRTLHGMIADFLRDNPDIDRSYYQEIWDWLEKKEGEENVDERILASIADCVGLMGEDGGVFSNHNVTKACVLSYLEKQKERKPIINFPVFIEEKYIEQAIKKFLGESAKFQKEQTFTHHEIDESLQDAVTHQMEDDGDVDDFVRRGIDDIVLKYAEIGAKWQKEQKPAEWSEEDEKQLNWFYRLLDFIGEEFPLTWGQNHKGGKEWLKSLRPQQKQEWSEEEKKTILFVIDVLRANHPDGFFKTSPAGDIHVTGITVEKLIKKLKSLLSRFE